MTDLRETVNFKDPWGVWTPLGVDERERGVGAGRNNPEFS